MPSWLNINPRVVKTLIRCWIPAWAGVVLMLVQPSIQSIGQAAFFMVLVQMMCPPTGIETIFIFAALSIGLGMLLAWGWGTIAMKAAQAARPAAATQAQLQYLEQVAEQQANQTGTSVAVEANNLIYEGYMLDARVSAVFLVLCILFIYFISLLRIKNPKFIFTQVFGIIIIDIFLTIGPLLPSFDGTLPQLIIEPAAIGLGLAFVASLVLFPQSTSYITLDSMEKIVDTLKVPLEATLEIPTSKSEQSQKAASLNATKQGLLGQWRELQPILGFLTLDLSVGRWNNKDIMNVEDDLRKTFLSTMNILNFQIGRLSGSIQSRRALEMVPSTAQSEESGSIAVASTEEGTLKEKGKTDVGFHQINELSIFLKAIHDTGSADIQAETRTMLANNSFETIEACVEALESVKECFHAVNSARLSTPFSQETHDKHVEKSEAILEKLRAARSTFIEQTTDELLIANEELFDAEGKIKALDSHLGSRFGAVVFGMIFEDHIIGVVDGIASLLDKSTSLYKKKTKARIWFPAGIRQLAKWIFVRSEKAPIKPETAYDDPDEAVDESNLLKEKLGIAMGVRKKPRSRFARIIGSFHDFFVSPDSLYALRMAVVSIALVIPAVLPQTAGFYYRERGLWALIMGQTTMLAYMADFTYSVITRIIGSVVGGVLGLVAWYIGSGIGEGSPYGLAASVGVFLIPIIYARVYLPRQFTLPTIMGGATFCLVIGYSYDYAHIPGVYGLPGYGYAIFWRRLLLVFIGIAASIIVQILPRPVSATRHVSRMLSGSIRTICDHYALLLSSLGDTENPSLQAFIGQESIQLSESLGGLDMLIALIKYEISTTNFDSASLAQIKELCLEINYSLGRLLYITSSISLEYQERLARQVGLRSHHAIGDVMAVLGIIEQSLKTGDALPEVLPTPLVKRCFDNWIRSDMSLIMSHTRVRDPEYRKFCTALSSYLRFLGAVDDLVLVMKETLGEAHVVSRELLHQT